MNLVTSIAVHQFPRYIWHFVVGNIMLTEFCQFCWFYDKEYTSYNFVEFIARHKINEICSLRI